MCSANSWFIQLWFYRIVPIQIPTSGPIGDIDYSNEMTALGVNLDMLKDRASDIIKSYRHSLSVKNADTFDPAVNLFYSISIFA